MRLKAVNIHEYSAVEEVEDALKVVENVILTQGPLTCLFCF